MTDTQLLAAAKGVLAGMTDFDRAIYDTAYAWWIMEGEPLKPGWRSHLRHVVRDSVVRQRAMKETTP